MSEPPPPGPDPDDTDSPDDHSEDADPAKAAADPADADVDDSGDAAGSAEPATPRKILRPGPVLAVAVAAVLAIGGGNYLVDAVVTDRTAAGVAAAPDAEAQYSLSVSVGEVGEPQWSLPAEIQNSRRFQSYGYGNPGTGYPGAGGADRTEFSQVGLSTAVPDDGQVSAINPTATGAALSSLAAVVGIDGELMDTSDGGWESWIIGPQDGTGRSAHLDGTGGLVMSDPTLAQDDAVCESRNRTEPGAGMPVEPCATPTPPSQLDRSVAETTMRSVLDAAGLDSAAYSITWEEEAFDGDQSWAMADPGWLPTPAPDSQQLVQPAQGLWTFHWDGDVLADFNGKVAELTPAGTYPLLSPAQAVDRLSDPRFAPPTRVGWSVDGSAFAPSPPGAFTGGPIPWPVAQRVITSAELQQAALTLADDVILLAPTYVLRTDDGNAWQVNALADAAYNFTG